MEASLCLKCFHMWSISNVAKGCRSAVTLTSAQKPQLINRLVAVHHFEEFNRINVALCVCWAWVLYRHQVFAPFSGVSRSSDGWAWEVSGEDQLLAGLFWCGPECLHTQTQPLSSGRLSCSVLCVTVSTHPFLLLCFLLLFAGFVTVLLTPSQTLHFYHVCSLFLLKSISLCHCLMS